MKPEKQSMLVFVLLFLLPLPMLHAQSKQDTTSKSMRLFSFGDVLEGWSYAVADNPKVKLLPVIPNRSRSKKISVPATPELLFYAKDSSPAPDAPPPQPVAKVNLSSASRDVLIVIFPVPGSNPQKYVAAAFPDDSDAFPLGSYKFLNATKRSLSGVLGDQSFTVEPSRTTLVKPSPSEAGLQLTIADSRAPTKPLMRRGWIYRPNFRTIAFLREVGDPAPVLVIDSLPQSEASMNEPAEQEQPEGQLEVQTIQER